MSFATGLVLLSLAVFPSSTLAAPLTDKSKSPDWGKASQAEKDAWIAAFKFDKADADKAEVAACLDQYAGKPLFEKSDLDGVTGMCETIAALPR